jgi:glycosyltransferase involved in cell wall biosynthesis
VPTGISALICTRDRPEGLVRAAKSVLADPNVAELFVIDQSTCDETRHKLRALSDRRVHWVKSERKGKGGALNEGLGLARGEVLACTDDDCVVPPGWASAMADGLQAHPRAAISFCSVIPVAYDPSRGYVPTYDAGRGRELRSLLETWKGHGLGAGMAVRRAAMLELGGFDEMVGPGAPFPSADDWDLSHRALLRGWSVLEIAGVAVTHDGFRTFAQGRAHALRDWLGIGAVCAKPVRAGYPLAILLPLWEFTAHALVPPFLDLLRLRRPRGLSRIGGFLRGFWQGLRTPVEPGSLKFRPGQGPRS